MRFYVQLNELTARFNEDLNTFLFQCNLPLLSPQQTHHLLHDLYSYHVDLMLVWTDKKSASTVEDDILTKHFPWWDPERFRKHDRLTEDFYHRFDEVSCSVSESLYPLMAQVDKANYRVWYLKLIYSDLHFEVGEDFRIVDWERRMASGEWKP